jgi:deoxyribonuclease V
MRIRPLHSWDLAPRDAVELQRRLAARVMKDGDAEAFQLIAGADVSYNRFSPTFYASVVVLRLPDLELVETAHAVREVRFPYVPGLLSFREAPVLLDAFARLRREPDVVVLDGQGVAHPRRLGLASHVGLWLDRPCIGCAKSLLTGTGRMPRRVVRATAPIVDHDEVIGMSVRTKAMAKPVYVSVGHRINLPRAVAVVLSAIRGYRLPEPTRLAHIHVNQRRRSANKLVTACGSSAHGGPARP